MIIDVMTGHNCLFIPGYFFYTNAILADIPSPLPPESNEFKTEQREEDCF